MNPWILWVRWWNAEESGTSLALFRIAVALVITLDALTVLVAGVVEPLYLPSSEGGIAPFSRFPSILLDVLGHTGTTSWMLLWATLGLGTLSLVGLGGRVTHFLLLQVVLAWHAVPMDIGGGYDRLMTNALFLLTIGNATATLSLDSRIRHGAWRSNQMVMALPRYLAIFLLAIMYTAAGIAKDGSGWSPPFDAVFRVLQLDSWARFEQIPGLWMAYPLTQVGTVVSLWWEILFFVLVPWYMAFAGWLGERAQGWARRIDLRWPLLGIGVLMHAVLGVFLNVGTFTSLSLCFYVTCITPEEWRRWLGTPGLAAPDASPAPAAAVGPA